MDHFPEFLEKTPKDQREGHELILSILLKIFPYAGFGAPRSRKLSTLLDHCQKIPMKPSKYSILFLVSRLTKQINTYSIPDTAIRKIPKRSKNCSSKTSMPVLAPHSFSGDNHFIKFISMLLDPRAKQEPLVQLQLCLIICSPIPKKPGMSVNFFLSINSWRIFLRIKLKPHSILSLCRSYPNWVHSAGPIILG